VVKAVLAAGCRVRLILQQLRLILQVAALVRAVEVQAVHDKILGELRGRDMGGTQSLNNGVTPLPEPSWGAGTGQGSKPGGGAQSTVRSDPNQGRAGTANPSQGGKPGGGGGPGGAFAGQNPGFNPTGGIFDFNPQTIAGLSPLEQYGLHLSGNMPNVGASQYGMAQSGLQGLMRGQLPWQTNAMTGGALGLAGGQTPQTAQEAMALYRQMPGVAGTQVTGANIDSDPAFQAAQSAIMGSVLPSIQNAAVASGLGRSQPALNAQATAASQYMLPVIQDALGREERGIDRRLGGMGTAAGGLMGGAGMQQQGQLAGLGMLGQAGQMQNQNMLAGTQGMMNLGDTQQRNMLNAIQTMMGAGQLPRQLEQQQNDAMWQEWMRIMGTGENAISGPLGMVPNVFGSSSISRKK
jgi:hypothetical protein